MAQRKLLEKIKNNGNKVFLPCGRWLDKNEEAIVTTPEAKLMVQTNKHIVIVKEQKKKNNE